MDYDVLFLISYNSLDVEDILIKKNSKEDKIMKKKIGLLIATVMVLNTMTSMAYGWSNPLKDYNLYDDTHPTNSDDGSKEQIMQEYYSNSLGGKSSGANSVPKSSLNYSSNSSSASSEVENATKRRNEILRESSRQVYGNPEVPAGWVTAQSFYQNPSLNSIRAKYKQSNFAGCMQECISYVRLHPNDTLGFYYLAMCYTKVSDRENAIKAYEKVISLNANPMIVKYATNGRNCVLENADASSACYQNVNEPDLIYPYANVANNVDLTPVDPNVLIHRNLVNLQNKLAPKTAASTNPNDKNAKGTDSKDNKGISLPFGQQDEKLDQFINAPYGNGLSPDLNKEYKQLQLRKIQESINTGEDNPEKDMHNINDIKHFDDQKSDLGTMKLAYVAPSDEMKKFSQDPEFVQSQKELDELRMMLGNDSSSKSSNDDLMNLLPYMTGQDKNLSPEVIQAMMVKSMMPDFTFVNSDSKNLL